MSIVFLSLTTSVDGYIAPDGMTMEHADDPDHNDWMRLWSQLQSLVLPQRAFRERLEIGEGGQTGPDNDLVEHTFARTGASVMAGGCSTAASAKDRSVPPSCVRAHAPGA